MLQESAIIIFVRAPKLGKVKTRLAATIGNEKALAVYQFLLAHTYGLVKDRRMPVFVFYADAIVDNDLWSGDHIVKRLQEGNNLGERMMNAFTAVFATGSSKALIIGSDCYELTGTIIDEAFASLSVNDIVIGPAKDGGYYLLGMHAPVKNVFSNIEWSTDTVFRKTLERVNQQQYRFSTLAMLRDVDTEDDINFSY
jgi:uncharacterized protein